MNDDEINIEINPDNSNSKNDLEDESNKDPSKYIQNKINELQKIITSQEEKIKQFQSALASSKNYCHDLEKEAERREKQCTEKEIRARVNLLKTFFSKIYENLIRAMDSKKTNGENVDDFAKIIKHMEILLSEHNIKPIDVLGKKFDYNIHECIQTVEKNDLDDETIIEEVAKGYMYENEVIFPSKVIISKKTEENVK